MSKSLAIYRKELEKLPLLSKEEELMLAIEAYENKSKEAAKILVERNLRFVYSIAVKYTNYGLPVGDLIQEGTIGLMHAIRNFDPYKRGKLITYAVYYIRSYIHTYIRKNYSIISLDNTVGRKLFKRKNPDEMAKYQTTDYDNSEAHTEKAFAICPKQDKEKPLIRKKIGKAFGNLNERERRIVLESVIAEKSLAVLASKMNISKTRVSQIKIKALAKLETKLERSMVNDCL